MTGAERAALRAARQLPYPSFPCLADKKPACPNGFKAAALPEMGLATLWLRHPGVLVGVPTGSGSGFSVLDIDKGKGGGDWWAANKARLPQTRMHRTRSGGIHCLFQHRAGLLNSVSKIAPGVDVRASGGYVIFWPSHVFPVVDHELAEWPQWLAPPEPPPPPPRWDLPSPRQAVAAVEGIVRVVATAPKGQRNAVTYWGARRLRELHEEGRLTEGLAREIILDAAARNGLPAREIALTIKSAFEAQLRG
jgi:Bifunctional DNA primase/polymerase, N-terminal